ncbi:glycosyltransferase family 4 protein [Neobacillus sp. PS2-9]|uniref:glycosyltransferase family 4 protein n=1 Tax=Neobacillus sp. PS2-9 TaxID=3070676 RepID=UPI0027E0A090|nr:glycosyltransferase family 4 protein [Neobacillus sp. PS2-9]WML58622.1 glycosyltransferase family 4 protein [Neobacillus sp. PS2-9]
MKKNVWIMNHYATNMFFESGGRHYFFADYLNKKNYQPTIFCASTNHFDNNAEPMIPNKKKYVTDIIENIPFVFIKSSDYKGNGVNRLKNMFTFYTNLRLIAKEYARKFGKPDIILASSVHPLTLLAGLSIAKIFKVPCICEVRDLWPESIIAYGSIEKESLIAKLMYAGEKWIYKKADRIIMTWEGGKSYIIEHGWDSDLDVSKVYHISNGVALNKYDSNANYFTFKDSDLEEKEYINIVYTGSIRKVNNIDMLLDVAKQLSERGKSNIRFLIFGDGDERISLEQRCKNEGIQNVKFKGRVDKKYIPNILKQADINILHNKSTMLDKYGQSQNKFFEYLAAGKCIIQTYSTGYSVLQKYKCGVSSLIQTPNDIVETILSVTDNEEKRANMGANARNAALDFDFSNLTDRLIDIIENV